MTRLSYAFIIEQPHRIVLTAISTTIFVALLRYFVGAALALAVQLSDQQHSVADAITAGMLAGLAMFLVLRSARKRRVLVLREMSCIADLNHHVRNSLQVILGTELMKKEANVAVVESCERIRETIERLFPIVGIERRHHRGYAAGWHSSQRAAS
jgi:hypothetical protein